MMWRMTDLIFAASPAAAAAIGETSIPPGTILHGRTNVQYGTRTGIIAAALSS